MKTNYHLMTSDQLMAESKRLNKKLVIPNIIIAVIAIVACVCQLIMPFFKVTVNLNSNFVASTVDVIYADYEDDECILGESDDSVMSKLMTKSNIKNMTSKLDSTVSIKLSAFELLSLGFASDDAAEDEVISFLAGILEKMNISSELETALNAIMPTVISTYVTETITTTVTEALAESGETGELTEDQTEVINIAASSIEESIQKLAETTTAEELEEVKAAVKEEVIATVETTIADLAIENITDEDIASITDMIDENFDELISYATDESGSFSYTELLNNLDDVISLFTGSSSDGEGDSSDESGSTELTDEQIAAALLLVPDEIKAAILATLSATDLATMTEAEQNRYIYEYYIENYTSSSSVNNTGVIRHALTADSTASSGTTEDNTTSTITKYISYLNNEDYEGLINEILGEDGFSDSTIQTIKISALVMFLFIALISLTWAILAILAIVHIFIANKKVAMWYVKAFGGLAAILFFIVPLILILLKGAIAPALASLFGIEEAMLTTILGSLSFGGAGLIVLICLVVLWGISIFWCHPVKKKIKQCNQALNGMHV